MRLRKNQTDPINANGDATPDTRRRRTGRGWGPFSGGQLTAIILGITLAIAYPVGAWAVSGSNVFVTDSISGKTARVDRLGNQKVAISDKVSGREALVNSEGKLGVAPEPAVYATGQINATGAWTSVGSHHDYPVTITSLNVDTSAVTPGTNDAVEFASSSSSCSSVSGPIEVVHPGGIGLTSMDLGPGLELPPTVLLCVFNTDPTHLHASALALYRPS